MRFHINPVDQARKDNDTSWHFADLLELPLINNMRNLLKTHKLSIVYGPAYIEGYFIEANEIAWRLIEKEGEQ